PEGGGGTAASAASPLSQDQSHGARIEDPLELSGMDGVVTADYHHALIRDRSGDISNMVVDVGCSLSYLVNPSALMSYPIDPYEVRDEDPRVGIQSLEGPGKYLPVEIPDAQ